MSDSGRVTELGIEDGNTYIDAFARENMTGRTSMDFYFNLKL